MAVSLWIGGAGVAVEGLANSSNAGTDGLATYTNMGVAP